MCDTPRRSYLLCLSGFGSGGRDVSGVSVRVWVVHHDPLEVPGEWITTEEGGGSRTRGRLSRLDERWTLQGGSKPSYTSCRRPSGGSTESRETSSALPSSSRPRRTTRLGPVCLECCRDCPGPPGPRLTWSLRRGRAGRSSTTDPGRRSENLVRP